MLPAAFINRLKKQFPEEWEEIISSIEKEPQTSIRYHPRKNNSKFQSNIPWSKDGVFLDERPQFTLDPLFHGGAYYVQEASSMFIDYVLDKLKAEISFDRVLDLCAAPGGKSTIILNHLRDSQYLISNEVIPKRNSILRENLIKWGYPNFLVTENKPEDFQKLEKQFDLILVDAPCSGEGLFRKSKHLRNEWTEENVDLCERRQEDILKTIWSSLKEGGFIVYSTCTYNPQENEELLERLYSDGYDYDSMNLNVPNDWDINTVKTKHSIGYQFLPHKVKGEGFFCSVLRKKGAWGQTSNQKSKSYINNWLDDYLDSSILNSYSTYKFKKSLFLAPNILLDNLDILHKNMYVKQIGVEIGNYKGSEIYPSHGLAMLSFPNKFKHCIELSKEEAIQYLSKEQVNISHDNGVYLLSYLQHPLGWLEVQKGKEINQYPSNWRIRLNA